MKRFEIGHLFNCTLVDSGAKLGANTILTKGMRVLVKPKRINYHKTEKNIFSVLVKKQGSNQNLEKRFYKSLKKDLNINKDQVVQVSLVTQGDSKVKITFETKDNQNYHQVLVQRNKLFINNRHYNIKIVQN